MSRNRALLAAALSLSVLFCHSSFAQQGLQAPRPVVSPQPPQPVNAAGDALEGVVTLRYSVLADGTPANIRVVDVLPSSIDSGPTLEAFGGWEFLPASRDGTAIDWHNNETKIVFRSRGGASPTADAFAAGYTEVASLLEAGEYDDALAASRNLIAEHASRLSELGLALVQQAIIFDESDDAYSALGPLQAATDPEVPMLNGVELYAAVQLRLQVEQSLSHTREAIQSYKRLTRALGPKDTNPIKMQGDGLMRLWDEEPLLAVFGRIDDGTWRYDLGRPLFYVDGIEGRITTLDAECDTRRISIDFDPDADYSLAPASFGSCTLFIHGDNGTKFQLIEALPQP